METISSQILLQIVFILLNAFFAGAEIAFLSLNPVKLGKQASDGDKTAAVLLQVVENPNSFLSGIQVAITLSGFLSAAFGSANFSVYLDSSPEETQARRIRRGRDENAASAFIQLVVSIEGKKLQEQAKRADVIVGKDGHIYES